MQHNYTIVPKGPAITERRIRAGLSTADVAAAAEITVSPLLRAERGIPIRQHTATAICKALNADFDDLFVIKYRSDGQAAAAQ